MMQTSIGAATFGKRPLALAIIKLCFCEGISQSVSQSAENSVNCEIL